MNEFVKVLNEKGEDTGNTISKSDAHLNGICHGISVVALIDITQIKKQESEVENIKLVDLKEFQDLLKNNEMVEGAKFCGDIMKYMKWAAKAEQKFTHWQ